MSARAVDWVTLPARASPRSWAAKPTITVLYVRFPRLFADLAVVHGSPGYAKLLRTFVRVKLLILDDLEQETLNADWASHGQVPLVPSLPC